MRQLVKIVLEKILEMCNKEFWEVCFEHLVLSDVKMLTLGSVANKNYFILLFLIWHLLRTK